MEYIVKAGDTLALIAKSNGTTVATVMRLNPTIKDPNRIQPQQVIQLPNNGTQTRQTRSVGQVCESSACNDEFVDLVHQAKEGVLIPITLAQQKQFQQEEAQLEQLIKQFYAGLQGAEEAIRQHKEAFLKQLQEKRVIDKDKPSEPFRLTEIRRLAGGKHYTYVRTENFWKPLKRHGSYKIESLDRARAQGWFDPASKKVDPKKLQEALGKDLKNPKLKFKLYEAFTDWCLLEWKSDPKSWPVSDQLEPITVEAQAQALRFAVGASLNSGYEPKKMQAFIAAQASGSTSLVEGKASVSTAWPAEGNSEWAIVYIDDNGQRKEASLGKFRTKAKAELAGFAGASALVAANVNVNMTGGIPSLSGVGGKRYAGDDDGPAKAEASVFAGVRADGKLEGSVEWKDTLVAKADWKALCTLGVGAGAALGLGGEAQLRLKWSPLTGKFFFNVRAGLVVGAGASGEIGAEINTLEFLPMIHCIYNALLEVDFRKVESIQILAFQQLCNIAVYSLLTNSPVNVAARILGTKAAELVAESIDSIFKQHAGAWRREELAIQTGKNILKDASLGMSSWVRHAPPEVKGRLLDTLCFDYAATPWDYYTFGHNSREAAILTLLESSQSWRDYEESITRMNRKGDKGNFTANRQRLKAFMRLYPGARLEQIEAHLAPRKPVPNQPVRIARHIALSGIHYA